MRRREFIALVSGAVAWTLSGRAQAQQPLQSHRIALVATALPRDMTEEGGEYPFFRVFFPELRRLGYIEGHNLIVERYSAWGLIEPFTELAASVVRQKPDLILGINSRIVLALKLATTAIPIVGVMANPVAFGIVESLGRPGGNITGVDFNPGIESEGKQLDLLKKLLPQPTSVGFLVSRGLWDGPAAVAMRSAAQRMGISLFGAILESFEEAEYRRVFAAMKREGVAGILVGTQSENVLHRKFIVELARESRLPAIYTYRESAEDGGLMSYGPRTVEYFRRVAAYVAKILKGANPANLPFEQVSKFELVINLKTAKELDIVVPPTLLTGADEVIE